MARKVTAKSENERDIARRNWARYAYGKYRGHTTYCELAQKLEGMYVGGGEQWSDEDRMVLEEDGRLGTSHAVLVRLGYSGGF